MAIGSDRVQLTKLESTVLGGDDNDAGPYGGDQPIDPQEDAIESAGAYVQDASNRDEDVGYFRDGDALNFFDKEDGNTTGITLTSLKHRKPKFYKEGMGSYSLTASTLRVLVGSCRSDDDTTDITFSSNEDADITSSGLGGLDTGVEVDDVWYYIWAVYNPTTKDSGVLLSLSSISPTLPSGYTKKRRIGSVRNDGGDFRLFRTEEYGNYHFVIYDEYWLTLNNGTSTSWVTVDASDDAPTTSRLLWASMYVYGNYDVGGRVNEYGGNEDFPIRVKGGISWATQLHFIPLDSSQRLKYRVDGNKDEMDIRCHGYTEKV